MSPPRSSSRLPVAPPTGIAAPAPAPGQLLHPRSTGVPLGRSETPASAAAFPGAPAPSTPVSRVWWSDLLPTRSTTVAAWLLAAVPLGAVIAVGAVAWVQLAHPRWTLLALGIAAVAIVLVPVLLVANDHSALRRMGWERQPRALSILLGSVAYLSARQWALGRQGAKAAPLVVGTVLGAIAALALAGWAAWTWQAPLLGWLAAAQAMLP